MNIIQPTCKLCLELLNFLYLQGIHIFRAPGHEICYLVPVGVDPERQQVFETPLKARNDGEVRVDRIENVNYEVLPGKIEDTSFIPSGAHNECTKGYQWLAARTGNTGKHIYWSTQSKYI